jgi:DNA mismatch repair protein MutL
MNRIAKLPPEIAQKIAAGEVIERPVSVVKELVENALDAGAGEIGVELLAGGKKRIRVRDDGSGMSRADAELCFERHATSKIAVADDLLAIATLGFRGEALASIAAVSRLTLKTSEGGAEAGTQIEREGDSLLSEKDIAFPRGTSIEVRDLFFNLPARLKFLHGDASELSQIAKYLTNVALAYPRLRLILSHGPRTILDSPPVDGLRERIYQLHGKALIDSLMEIDFTADGSRLYGFASRPPAGRPDRAHQYFFVNSRPVRDKVLASALQQAYRGLLEKDRWPEAFLFLSVPPAEVDVNVHPAKSEVRFLRSSAVFQLVLRAVDRAKDRAGGIKPVVAARPEGSDRTGEPVEYIPGESGDYPGLPFRVEERLPAADSAGVPLFGDGAGTAPESDPSGRRVLGQFGDAYIIASDPDGIMVIDQHNAHERVLFERFTEIDRRRSWPVKMSLIPLLFELSPAQAVSLDANRTALEESGFRAEPMGGRSFALREYPDIFQPEQALSAFLDLLDEIRGSKAEEKKSRMLAMMACKTAIKAGQPLPREKMIYLVRELFRTANPAVCPHGRPIVVRLSKAEIEKGLRRR